MNMNVMNNESSLNCIHLCTNVVVKYNFSIFLNGGSGLVAYKGTSAWVLQKS